MNDDDEEQIQLPQHDTFQNLKEKITIESPSDVVPFDLSEWALEVERVTPLLKMHISNDSKDWRLHLTQLEKRLGEISGLSSQSNNQIKQMTENIHKNSEKMQSREKYISTHFESQVFKNN